MKANHKTLDVDRLFVRDIVFKDQSNKPISSSLVLTARGDGGTYFSDISNAPQSAFNKFHATPNIDILASNAVNTLWFEPGAGIEYYSRTDGVQPKVFIVATAPEQITVFGDGSTLKFSDLNDDLTGGRTLYFAGTGDTTVNVSSTTILFGSAYNSSYSSLTTLTSTTTALLEFQSTQYVLLSTVLETVDTLLLSSAVSTFWSTLLYAKSGMEHVSSFVYSTFSKDSGGNNTILNVNTINTNNIHTSSIQTSTITVGSNVFTEHSFRSGENYICDPYATNNTISTNINLLEIQDSYTHVKFAIEKEFRHTTSTFETTVYQTTGQQVQLGLFAALSTYGRVTHTARDQYAPILQQREVLEETIYDGATHVVTNYTLHNSARLDEICAPNDLVVHAHNVAFTDITIDTVNGFALNRGLSSFSVAYIDKISPSTLGVATTISSMSVSSMNGMAFGTFSTTNISTLFGYNASVLDLAASTFRSGYSVGSNAFVSTLRTGYTAALSISTNTISSGIGYIRDLRIGDGIAQSLSVQTLSSGTTTFQLASGTSVNAITLSTSGLGFSNASGTVLAAQSVSTGTTSFNLAVGNSISTNNLSTSYIGFLDAQGSRVGAQAVSTGTLTFDSGRGNALSTSTIAFFLAAGPNISTTNISTAALQFKNASGGSLSASMAFISTATVPQLFASTINGYASPLSTFSTLYWSTAQGLNATISTLRVSTIMGTDLPILTFDMAHRRIGVNLGATQQPRATVDISGIVYASNFVTTSDKRLKTDIVQLDVPPTIPRGYRFRWREGGESDIGVMAEEVEAFAPECIYIRPDGYKAVSYMKLVPVCLTLIQSLSDRLERLEGNVA